MTDELKKSLNALRAIGPRLNSITDEATKVVRRVEKILVEELKIGVTFSTGYFYREAVEANDVDQEANREVFYYLEFGRMGRGYAIYVSQCLVELDGDGDVARTVMDTKIAWSSCDRETKLRAFHRLPELIDGIVDTAQGVAALAESTLEKVKAITDSVYPDGTR